MEAMSEEEIKVLIYDEDLLALTEPNTIVGKKRLAMARLILTYATAKAEAERLSFWEYHDRRGTEPEGCPECDQADDKRDVRKRHLWKNEDWLNSVLFKIGWPKEA